MRTATQKRANSHLRYYPVHHFVSSKKRKLKGIYTGSIKSLKKHPYWALGFLTLGIGFLSGIFLIYRMKR